VKDADGSEHAGPGPGGYWRTVRIALALAALGVVSATLGWTVTDHLEQDNDFCNACHLEPDLPLHAELRADFDAVPPPTLAAAHAGAGTDGRAFRCIDCHGGVSFVGRARVKVLAGLDAFWYVAGHFEEPADMAWPLWDEDCRQCHASFDESEAPEWQSPRFHQLPVHNVELGVDCVECHRVHEIEVDADRYFLHARGVRTQCARCHSQFAELAMLAVPAIPAILEEELR